MVCHLRCSCINCTTHSRCVAQEGNLEMSVILMNPSILQRGPVASPVLAPKISGLSSTCCHVGFHETQSFGQRICPQPSEDSLPYFSPSVHKLPFSHTASTRSTIYSAHSPATRFPPPLGIFRVTLRRASHQSPAFRRRWAARALGSCFACCKEWSEWSECERGCLTVRPEDDWLESEGPVGIGPGVSDIGSRDASIIDRGNCMID